MEEEKNKNAQITKAETENTKAKRVNPKVIVVLLFVVIFLIFTYIVTKASYLEVLEIGEEYTESLMHDIKYKIYIGVANFICLFTVLYITNRSIKKGLKSFFEEEKKEMPKLPNKSLAFIISIIVSVIVANVFLEKTILFLNCTQFGITDPIFNLDIGFYMFQLPLIGQMIYYLLFIVIGITIYMAIYYIVVFNMYFDGINRTNIEKQQIYKTIIN